MKNVFRLKMHHWLWIGLISLMCLIATGATAAEPPEERLVRKLTFIAYSPEVSPNTAEAHKYIKTQLEKLGIQIDFKPMLYQGINQNMWFSRNYDLGTLYLAPRPTRVDPHVILSNLYHSRTDVIGGYNFAGYHNPECDEVIDASSKVLDQEERRKLIWKVQEIVGRDVPLLTLVHPFEVAIYNNQKWEGFVNMVGIGINNVFSFTQVKPKTADKILKVSYGVDAGVLNPMTAHTMNQLVCWAVYDTLTKVGPDGHPTPWLAESWKWISETEIEFKMRKNHKWHDGQPVTAKDVKFTIDFIKNNNVSFHFEAASPIKEVKILDDYTFRYILNHPFSPLLTYAGEQIYIVPEHIWKEEPWKGKAENVLMWSPSQEGKLIGSGFLKFEHWTKNVEIKLVANKEHFFAPNYDARIFRIIPSAEALLGALQKGEIDMAIGYSGDLNTLEEILKKDTKLTLNTTPSIGWYELDFNMRKPPLDDAVLRRAMAAVIPRDVIAKNIYKGFAIPAYSPTNPNLKPWYNPNVIRYEDLGIEWAKKTLKEAGYEWDSKGRLYYPAGRTNDSPRMDILKK